MVKRKNCQCANCKLVTQRESELLLGSLLHDSVFAGLLAEMERRDKPMAF